METIAQPELLRHAALTETIIGTFYDVYNELGHGFLESVYREAMLVALKAKGLSVEREKSVEVRFRGEVVGVFRTDLIVDDRVILELKCARTIDSSHETQLLNYLKATPYEVGLLLNFGNRPHFRRMVFESARKRPGTSLSAEQPIFRP